MWFDVWIGQLTEKHHLMCFPTGDSSSNSQLPKLSVCADAQKVLNNLPWYSIVCHNLHHLQWRWTGISFSRQNSRSSNLTQTLSRLDSDLGCQWDFCEYVVPRFSWTTFILGAVHFLVWLYQVKCHLGIQKDCLFKYFESPDIVLSVSSPGLICAAEHYDLPDLIQACFHHAKQFIRTEIACQVIKGFAEKKIEDLFSIPFFENCVAWSINSKGNFYLRNTQFLN